MIVSGNVPHIGNQSPFPYHETYMRSDVGALTLNIEF